MLAGQQLEVERAHMEADRLSREGQLLVPWVRWCVRFSNFSEVLHCFLEKLPHQDGINCLGLCMYA